jgi:hypothetical protein
METAPLVSGLENESVKCNISKHFCQSEKVIFLQKNQKKSAVANLPAKIVFLRQICGCGTAV